MAKFCKYCGSKTEEGLICNCQESLKEAAEILKINNTSNKSEVKKVNVEVNKIFGSIKEYFTDIKSSTKKAIKKEDKTFINGAGLIFILSILLNFVVMFNRIKININDIIKKFISYSGEFSFLEINNLKVELALGKVLLNGILLALAIGAILLVTILILSKFNKMELTTKEIIYTGIINTLPMSLILIVGAILKLFISYKYVAILQVIYLMAFMITIFITYNQVTNGLNTLKDIALFAVILCLATYINLVSYVKLVPKTFMAFGISGQNIEPIVEEFKAELEYNLEEAKEEFEDMNFEEIILEIIDDITYDLSY